MALPFVMLLLSFGLFFAGAMLQQIVLGVLGALGTVFFGFWFLVAAVDAAFIPDRECYYYETTC